MESRRLEELLSGVDIIYVNNMDLFRKFVVHATSTDTRSLKRNELFIALKGERYDANQFIGDAVELGSSGVVFEMRSFDHVKKVIKENPGVLFIGVNDTLNAYSMMAKNYLRNFKSLKRLAITGSSGKTTMRGLVASVLSTRYRTVASEKSYNNIVGVSKTIFSISNEHEFYVQEIGTNHPGEIAHLVKIVEPDFGLITNIGPAHIGYFGSIDEIAKEKKTLLAYLDENGAAFINRDDPFSNFLEDGIRAKVFYYGIKNNSDIKVKNIDLSESTFFYKKTEIKIHLPGRHNILNAVGAITVGTRFKVAIDSIKNALETYRPEEGRGWLMEVNGINVIDESYNANPLSVKASIDYLSELKCYGRKHYVFGDMAELGSYSEKYHRDIADYLKDTNIDFVYMIGNETFFTYDQCRKYKNRIKAEVEHFYQMNSLLKGLVTKLKRGDIVLVKGSRIMGLDILIDALKNELNAR